jgi:ATP-dependent exoDNAse (exonuclease V) alpha subunit
MRIILVGDPDQLPSVGPGKVLAELIDAGVIPHLHLSQVFRQAESSLIVTNAHRIRQGMMPEKRVEANYHFVERGDPASLLEACLDILLRLQVQGRRPWRARSAACASLLPLTFAEGTTHTHVNAVRSPELLRSNVDRR